MQQSSLTTGVVQGMTLTYQQQGVAVTAEVGSAAWFGWLGRATALAFRDAAGHFTAQKTRAGNRRGGCAGYIGYPPNKVIAYLFRDLVL